MKLKFLVLMLFVAFSTASVAQADNSSIAEREDKVAYWLEGYAVWGSAFLIGSSVVAIIAYQANTKFKKEQRCALVTTMSTGIAFTVVAAAALIAKFVTGIGLLSAKGDAS